MLAQQKCVFTVHWIVKDGEVEAALDIIARFAPEARKEPGLELLTIQQSADNPQKFMFYEIFFRCGCVRGASGDGPFQADNPRGGIASPEPSGTGGLSVGLGGSRLGPACFRLPALASCA